MINSGGICYLKGYGVSQNSTAAVTWFRNAANQGNYLGQFYLGICYLNGSSVSQDVEEAKKWFKKAADQGFDAAKKKLEDLEK